MATGQAKILHDKEVMVIGGGVCGIQAALDLADKGYQVRMVEREPTIGGRMAILDKVFPTNDCSICILAPKMIMCYNNPNIDVMTYAEVVKVEGKAGDFKVTVLKKPRYVNEDLCTGCGDCIEACVRSGEFPNKWDANLGRRGAAYMPFLQAVPRIACVDAETCFTLRGEKCKMPCIRACQRKAMDFKMKPVEVTLDVGAIIVATGLVEYDPTEITEYGYGRYTNVVTAMEYERLINASGPTGGHVHRFNDHEQPRRQGFIQCVGARDLRLGNPYCCSVCCMYATKDAMLAREHYPDIENFIFYTDLRAFGKGFDEYIRRGKSDYGITYVRAKPGEVTEDPRTKNLTIWYEDGESGGIKSLEVDFLVLSTAFVPWPGVENLAATLGVQVDEYGFFKAEDNLLNPLDSTRPGILIAGTCQAPMDVTDSVEQGGGAANRAAEIIAQAGKAPARKKVKAGK
jgi:heterodisulfide reductase subunit A